MQKNVWAQSFNFYLEEINLLKIQSIGHYLFAW